MKLLCFLLFIGMIISLPTHSQTIIQDNIVLNQPSPPVTLEYMGIYSVTLKPGFSYKATALNTFRAFIPKRMSYGYDASGNRTSRTIILSTARSAMAENKHETAESFPDEIMTMSPPVVEEPITEETKLKIYPNPVESILNIELDEYDFTNKGEIIIVDLGGRIVVKKIMEGQITQINMGSQMKGLYVLRIMIKDKISTWRIIKK